MENGRKALEGDPIPSKRFSRLVYAVGITAPPPGQNERQFVFWWLGGIVFTIAAVAVIFYVIFGLGVAVPA